MPLADPPDRELALGPSRGHRAHAGRALGGDGPVGADRLAATRSIEQAGHLALPRAPAVQGHRALLLGGDRPDLRRDGRRGERGHQQGDHLGLRPLPGPPLRAGARGDQRHDAGARLPRRGLRAPGGDRGDRHVRGRALGQGARRAGRRGVRRPPAGPPDHRLGRRGRIGADPRHRRLPRLALRGLEPGAGRGGQPRARAGGRAGRAPARRPRRGRRERLGPASSSRGPTARFHTKDTEQYHLALGGPGLARGDDRRFALRVLDTLLGGLELLAPVPGGAREARPGLRGLLVRQQLRRHRPGGRLRGHPPRQRGRGAGDHRRAAAAAAGRPRARPRSSSGPRRT